MSLDFSIYPTDSEMECVKAIGEARKKGIRDEALVATTVGRTQAETIYHPSIKGNPELELAASNVVESIIALLNSSFVDCRVLVPEDAIILRKVPRERWNGHTIFTTFTTIWSSSYYNKLNEFLLKTDC